MQTPLQAAAKQIRQGEQAKHTQTVSPGRGSPEARWWASWSAASVGPALTIPFVVGVSGSWAREISLSAGANELQ